MRLQWKMMLVVVVAMLVWLPVVVMAANGGTFVATGSMTSARQLHSMTILQDGSVLVAGGNNGNTFLSSAEVYAPDSGKFMAVGNLSTPRDSHTATLLNNGKVLIAGGENGGTPLSSSELYDPVSKTFSPTGSMNKASWVRTATKLPNGNVLITGGTYEGVDTAEIYDPNTGRFTMTGTMNSVRWCHVATLLPNGKVLITGGANSSDVLSSAELFDPVSGTFTTTGNMHAARYLHQATLLKDGTVLITGGSDVGYCGSAKNTAEVYDPATGTFTDVGTLNSRRGAHGANLLSDGSVLIVGGCSASEYSGALKSAELYNPVTKVFTAILSSMLTSWIDQMAAPVTLANGNILIAGGNNGTALSSAELYTPPPTNATNATCGTANGTTVSTAPTTNLCTTGTASAVTGSGPWNWTCSGGNGGTNASCSATKGSVELLSGLVAYYPFNGNANDESGNGNNGTVNGATLTTDRFGNAKSAYNFTGTDQYIIFPSFTLLPQGNSARSMSGWVKTNGSIIGRTCYFGYGGAYTGTSFDMCSGILDDGKVYFINFNPGDLAGNSVIADGSWHHIGISYDGSVESLYVDGKFDSSTTININTENVGTYPLVIGRQSYPDSGSRYWHANATIDEVRVYNRALTLSEVQALYGETATGQITTATCGTANNTTATTAPTTNLCTTGSASIITGTGPWSWTCSGSNGGANASCSASASTSTTTSLLDISNWTVNGASISMNNGQLIIGANPGTGASIRSNQSFVQPVTFSWTGYFPTTSTSYISAGFGSPPYDANGNLNKFNHTFINRWEDNGSKLYWLYTEVTNLQNHLTNIVAKDGYFYGTFTLSWRDNIVTWYLNNIKVGERSVSGSDPVMMYFVSADGQFKIESINVTQGTSFTPTNPICGSANLTTVTTAPTTNLCTTGSASTVTGSGPWYWNCTGNNGGTTSTCSANSEAKLDGNINQIDIVSCPAVKLYVTATDQAGSPVTGLTSGNFVVKEDGITQTPITVTTVAQSAPVSVALTLDYSGSMKGQPITDMQNAAVNFINQLGTLDTAEIVKFSTTVETVQGFTTGKSLLSGAITAPWSGADGSTALYDAIYQAISDTTLRGGRMAVIAMTDGSENASTLVSSLPDMINFATSKGVPIFTIGVGTVDTNTLQQLAAGTGGQYFYAPTSADLQSIYNRIANIINNQYIITYNTTGTTVSNRTVSIDITSGSNFVSVNKVYSGCTVGASNSSITKAKVYLGSNDTFTVSNSGATIFGGDGTDVVKIASGISGVILDQNIDRVDFPATSGSYTFKQTGNKINIYDTSGVTLISSLPVQGDADGTLLSFTNGTASTKLVTGVMTIGGAIVSNTSATTVTPATTASTPLTTTTTKAKIYLGSNDNFTVNNSGATVYGNSGYEIITIAVGISGVTLDQNIERINFSGTSSAYAFKQTGNKINIYNTSGSTLIATAPVQGDTDGTIIGFSNGNASALLSAGVMTVGGATVSSTAAGAIVPVLK